MLAAGLPELLVESGTEASLVATGPEGEVVSSVITHDDVNGTDADDEDSSPAAGLFGEPTFLHFDRLAP